MTAEAIRPAPGLLEGFAARARIIHALFMRELRSRFGHNPHGIIWLFLEPLMLGLTIGYIKTLTRGGYHFGGVSPFVLGIISYLPFFAFRGIVSRGTSIVSGNMPLMYHRQIQFFDIAIARNALESMAIFGVVSLICLGVAWINGTPPYSIPLMAFGLLAMCLYANGLAMLLGAGCAVSETIDRLAHPLTYLMLPFSGAFFPLHSIPPAFREALLWNPQPHFHEMLRYGMFGPAIPSYFDIPYAIGAIAIVNLLGMSALRAVRPKLTF